MHAPRALALAAALACLPLAAHANGAKLSVSLAQDGEAMRVLVRAPAGLEPEFGASSGTRESGWRVALTWRDTELSADGALPAALGAVRGMNLRTDRGSTRLEVQLDRPVAPSLRRAPEGWVIRLVPDASLAVATALPVAPTRSSPTIAAADTLLVDLRLNGQPVSGIVRAEQAPGGALLLAANDWTEARLAPGQAAQLSDGTPAYRLDSVAGVTYRIDRNNLKLDVNAPASAFVGSTLGPQGPAAPAVTPAEPGVLLNYDVSATRGANGASSMGVALELSAFGPWGSVVNSALVTDDGIRRHAQRLDTYWRYDMPERMESVTVGDAVGTGGGWSRPARFGGIRWGRDFGMRPGFITMPMPALAGEAVLPSTVEVIVNNTRRLSAPVAPGPFDLPNVPISTGAGELNLVVRDLLGRETIVRQSYYASPRLLAPGLTDFSVEAGRLRSGYGSQSAYGDAFATGTLRTGLTPQLTAEARIEVQAGRRAAGAEIAGLLGDLAVARAAVAMSSGDRQGVQESGSLVQLGVERQWPTGGATLQYEHASRGFAPFAEPVSAAAAALRARERWLASIGGPIARGISGSATFARQARWDGDVVTSLGLSLGIPLGERMSLGLNLSKRLDGDRAWTAGANLTIPLEEGTYAGARVDRNPDGRTVANASAVRTTPVGPGLGWRVEASSEAGQAARAGVQYNADHAELGADAAVDSQGRASMRAGARGSVGLLAGSLFASRPVGQNGFAIVEADGAPDVPVRRANQVVARTDAQGRALVTGLLPWQHNQIEIDPADLPMDVELRDLAREVTPAARSGSFVKFELHRSRQALVVLLGPDGQPVPVGTRVRTGPAGAEFIAGRRGEVWLTDLAEGVQWLHAYTPAGPCRAELRLAPSADGMPERIGPLACTRESP